MPRVVPYQDGSHSTALASTEGAIWGRGHGSSTRAQVFVCQVGRISLHCLTPSPWPMHKVRTPRKLRTSYGFLSLPAGSNRVTPSTWRRPPPRLSQHQCEFRAVRRPSARKPSTTFCRLRATSSEAGSATKVSGTSLHHNRPHRSAHLGFSKLLFDSFGDRICDDRYQ